jgi:hypothetical protein
MTITITDIWGAALDTGVAVAPTTRPDQWKEDHSGPVFLDTGSTLKDGALSAAKVQPGRVPGAPLR